MPLLFRFGDAFLFQACESAPNVIQEQEKERFMSGAIAIGTQQCFSRDINLPSKHNPRFCFEILHNIKTSV